MLLPGWGSQDPDPGFFPEGFSRCFFLAVPNHSSCWIFFGLITTFSCFFLRRSGEWRCLGSYVYGLIIFIIFIDWKRPFLLHGIPSSQQTNSDSLISLASSCECQEMAFVWMQRACAQMCPSILQYRWATWHEKLCHIAQHWLELYTVIKMTLVVGLWLLNELDFALCFPGFNSSLSLLSAIP